MGVVAVSGTLLQPGNDPETVKAAENSLLKLLPTIGKRLTMDDAMLLLQVYESGNQRLAPAIESAWTACNLTKEAVANEPGKRLAQKAREEQYWAKEDEKRRSRGLPTRAELMAGIRERREKMFSGPPARVSDKGDGKVEFPEPPNAPKRQNRERPDGMGATAGGRAE